MVGAAGAVCTGGSAAEAQADGAECLLVFRATCYRWMQVWPEVCADLATAPVLRAVADLHVENFGTWRDSDGRLIWGINDFDEACVFPYTSDLVRLVVSAKLAGRAEHLAVKLTRFARRS